MTKRWRVEGKDVFANEWYGVGDGFETYEAALAEARAVAKEVLSHSPDIRDRIYVLGPGDFVEEVGGEA
ncbi:MAG: hypothetical protein SGJ23_17155 [Alphaproteobacteria bacterium]|nr:hypothetical protein [Alphaproteobacteria bacterium]